MNPGILKALTSGFTPKQILNFFLNKFPQQGAKIKSALAAGYTAEQVLNYISGGKKDSKPMEGTTSFERMRNKDIQGQESREKKAITGAVLAGGSLAAPMAATALQRAIPSVLKPLIPQLLPPSPTASPAPAGTTQNISPLQSPNQPLSPPNVPVNQPNVPLTPPNLPPNVQSSQDDLSATGINPINSQGIKQKPDYVTALDMLGIREKLERMRIEGKSPEVIKAAANKLISKEQKDELAQNDVPGEPSFFSKLMDDFLTKPATMEKGELPEGESNAVPDFIEGSETYQPEVKAVAKGEEVATPHGIGSVKEIRNGKAIVEVDGKKHQVNEEDLEPEPEEVKEAKFDFDPSKIPEDLRSATLNEVYIPHDRRHISVKYNAGLKPIRYLYYRKDGGPIGTDFLNKIYKGVQLPVSSGLNFWGGWDATKADSRGSANYHELVANAQEEGEKDDSSKDYWFYKEEAVYEHPYKKETNTFLTTKEKEFNEKHKPKKRPAKKRPAKKR